MMMGAATHQSELDLLAPPSLAIVKAVDDMDPVALAAALAKSPADPVLSQSFQEGFRGTLLYRALDKGVLMANSGIGVYVEPSIECARLLRAAGAPAKSSTGHPADVAVLFLDSEWSQSPRADVLAEGMGELIDAGLIRLEERLPPHTTVGGLLPLVAACKVGNTAALAILLDRGAGLTAPLEDSGHTDLLALAGAVATTNRGAVVALIAEKLMKARLDAQSSNASAGAVRRRAVRI
jgi:hypothetical protein